MLRERRARQRRRRPAIRIRQRCRMRVGVWRSWRVGVQSRVGLAWLSCRHCGATRLALLRDMLLLALRDQERVKQEDRLPAHGAVGVAECVPQRRPAGALVVVERADNGRVVLDEAGEGVDDFGAQLGGGVGGGGGEEAEEGGQGIELDVLEVG